MDYRHQGCMRGDRNRSERDMSVAPSGSKPREANQSTPKQECSGLHYFFLPRDGSPPETGLPPTAILPSGLESWRGATSNWCFGSVVRTTPCANVSSTVDTFGYLRSKASKVRMQFLFPSRAFIHVLCSFVTLNPVPASNALTFGESIIYTSYASRIENQNTALIVISKARASRAAGTLRGICRQGPSTEGRYQSLAGQGFGIQQEIEQWTSSKCLH